LPVKVLIVEDDPSARIALQTLLAREGFRVQTADTLQRGKELLDGQAAIILDLDLPDGNGIELLRKVRAEKRTMKVLVVTACDDPVVRRDVRMLQPDGLLCKPVDLSEILQHLHPQG
jgi:two-component system response regulator PilR (NtrC family)